MQPASASVRPPTGELPARAALLLSPLSPSPSFRPMISISRTDGGGRASGKPPVVSLPPPSIQVSGSAGWSRHSTPLTRHFCAEKLGVSRIMAITANRGVPSGYGCTNDVRTKLASPTLGISYRALVACVASFLPSPFFARNAICFVPPVCHLEIARSLSAVPSLVSLSINGG